MDRTRALGWIGLGTVYVFVSSWFGLTGVHMSEGNWGEAAQFFADVWTNSLAADLVFVTGTLLAGWIAWRLLTRYEGLEGAVASIVLAGFAHWATYWASYLLLGENINHPEVEGLWEALVFVADWGKLGLILIAILPPLLRWLATQGHGSTRALGSLFKQDQA